MRPLLGLLLLLLLGSWLTVHPAYSQAEPIGALAISETETGIFDATLLGAPGGAPLGDRITFPTACSARELPSSPAPENRTVERWTLACQGGLGGETISYSGGPNDPPRLHLELRTLAGRELSGTLESGRAFGIPPRAAASSLLADGMAGGLAAGLLQPALWLLALSLVWFAEARPRRGGILGLLIGAAAGGWLAAAGALAIPPALAAAVIAAVAAVPAATRALAKERTGSIWREAPHLTGGLLGILIGGMAAPETLSWYSFGEREMLSVVHAVAAGLGLVAITALSLLVHRTAASRRLDELVANALTVAGVGLLTLTGAGLLLGPGEISIAAVTGLLLGVIAGTALPAFGLRPAAAGAMFFALLLAAGALLPLPASAGGTGLLAITATFVAAIFLSAGRFEARRLMLPLLGAAVVAAGWGQRGAVQAGEMGSGEAIALAVCVLLAFQLSLVLITEYDLPGRRRVAPVVGGAAAAILLMARLPQLARWVDGTLLPELALGRVPLPLLAITLALLALMMRPRRSRVATALGIARRPAAAHLALGGLALLLLPLGTVTVTYASSARQAPEEESLRSTVARLLSSTYHAFNLTDEGELYERLSQSVTGDLVANLYLDSRRRLAAGTADEDEVRIIAVELLDDDRATGARDAGADLLYSGRWIVTAEIRHLQHTHQRQNFYTGDIRLQMADGEWKIAGLELAAEERAVVP